MRWHRFPIESYDEARADLARHSPSRLRSPSAPCDLKSCIPLNELKLCLHESSIPLHANAQDLAPRTHLPAGAHRAVHPGFSPLDLDNSSPKLERLSEGRGL